MKKITALVIFGLVLAGANAFAGEIKKGRLIGLDNYVPLFIGTATQPDNKNAIRIESKYGIAITADENYAMFCRLEGNERSLDTYLEFALASYYIPAVVPIRPPEADTMLPANNPKLSGQILGANVYKEIIILRFLGDTAAVSRYEAMLQFITGRGNVTRAEVETFYRNNIRSLISEIVDEEFKGITVPASTISYVKDSLVNFNLTPNQSNFNTLKSIYHSTDGNIDYVQQSYDADMENLEQAQRLGLTNLIEDFRSTARTAQNILNARRRQLNAPNDAPIDWSGFRSAYYGILNNLNTELVKKM